MTISGLSLAMCIAGIGLGSSAVAVFMARAESRVAQDEQLIALEQNAEVAQRDAQLQRNYDAPVWEPGQVYDPSATYSVEGVRQNIVPVLIGPELDTAVCIGTMGPDGFIQNPDDPLCLGY